MRKANVTDSVAPPDIEVLESSKTADVREASVRGKGARRETQTGKSGVAAHVC